MTYGLWLSAGGLQVNEYRQAIGANNLANADTVGFKHDLALIRQRRVESQASADGMRFGHSVFDNLSGGNWVQPTAHSFRQGDLVPSSNPLDLAIEGKGFFAVSDGQTVHYTRDGRFTTNRAGELVMVAGGGRQRVTGQSGSPIRLTPGLGKLTVSSDGTIKQGDTVIGQIRVVEFADRQNLRKVGANLFAATGGAEPLKPSESRVHSGFTERSTVNPMEALASTVEVSRAYQLNATLISLQDQTLGLAVNTVGRVR